jgi:hypothetical protein
VLCNRILRREKSLKSDKEGLKSETVSKAETESAGELSRKFKLTSWPRKEPRKRPLDGKVKDDDSRDEPNPPEPWPGDVTIFFYYFALIKA